jgi:hypothetical protein
MSERRKDTRRQIDLANKLNDLSAEDLRGLITAIMRELARRESQQDGEPGTTQAGLDYLDDIDEEENEE